jgi:hypothetical protein
MTRSMFSVPSISRTIAKQSSKPRTIDDRFLAVDAPKGTADPFRLPILRMSPKRAGLLRRLIERGRVHKSDHSFKDLQLKKCFPDLVHVEVDCMDEAELRSRFPKQGVNHKFFSSGDFKFEFHLSNESDNVVVAQVLRTGKVRMPHDL